MDRATRPLVIIGAFAASLAVGLLLMMWAMGGLKNVTAPAAIGGPFQLRFPGMFAKSTRPIISVTGAGM